MKLVYFLFLLLIFVLSTLDVFCVGYASPLGPGKPERERIIGLWLAFGQSIQNGTSYVDCEECQFQNGVGFGYNIGISYEEQLAREIQSDFRYFYLGGFLHINDNSVSSAFKIRTGTYFKEYDLEIPVNYRNISDISILSAGIMPYIRFNPINWFSLRLGYDISYILSNNVKHTMELLDRRSTLNNGEVTELYLQGKNDRKTYSVVKQNSEIKDIQLLQMSLVPAVSFNLNLSNKCKIATSLMYFIPFTNTSNYKDGFSISNWRAGLEIYYNFVTN